MADRLERLTTLVANLLDTRTPLTLEQIVQNVPGYPEEKASYRRQFERDKDTLRGIGVPISVETVGNETMYRIRPDEYYLPALDLTPEEQAAIHVAVTAVRLPGVGTDTALWKIGGQEGEAVPALASLPTTPALAELFDAYRKRATVTFTHRGAKRRLDPYGLVFRRGHWYVVGRDHDREDPRAFRADRIDGEITVGNAGAFTVPEGLDPATLVRDDPMRFGSEDASVEARILVDAEQAAFVVEELGEAAVETRHADGSVVVTTTVTNRAAFRSFVLGLLDRAEVLGPPDLRAETVAWLDRISGDAA
ncbi:MAG: pafB [Actinomycetia bacterium]|nr:pafB [Actinomycetes bacterium]